MTAGPHEPALSVVIPAYNAADTIATQLDALASQDTGVEWEVIVADNGSDDGTPDVVSAFARRLPSLRLADASARKGAAAARNIGAARAQAPWIAFCDADDQVTPGWVDGMCRALASSRCVYGSWDFDPLNTRPGVTLSWTGQMDVRIVKDVLPVFRAFDAANFGIERELFNRVGGFEEHLAAAEDVDLAWRLQLAGIHPAYHPELVVNVRKRLGLVPTFRQGLAYGTGDRQLAHRYAAVAASWRSTRAASRTEDTEPERRLAGVEHRLARARTVVAKALRARHRADFGDRTFRVGNALGRRFGKIPDAMTQVAPPEPRYWETWV